MQKRERESRAGKGGICATDFRICLGRVWVCNSIATQEWEEAHTRSLWCVCGNDTGLNMSVSIKDEWNEAREHKCLVHAAISGEHFLHRLGNYCCLDVLCGLCVCVFYKLEDLMKRSHDEKGNEHIQTFSQMN